MSVELRKHFTIIVSTVVVENDNILMMQEAKRECLGLWYLPAGRLEKHENLVEGAKRECKEETGLDIEPISILSIEMQSSRWIRINFIGKTIGGKLKKQADKESLSADWIPLSVILNGGNKSCPLRSVDIVSVVKCFVNRDNSRNNPGVLPAIIEHNTIQFIIYIIHESDILVDKITGNVPIFISNFQHSFQHFLTDFYQNNLRNISSADMKSIKILTVEFSGTRRHSKSITDGIQFRLVIQFDVKPDLSSSAKIDWKSLSEIAIPDNLTNEIVVDLPPLVLL